MTEAPFHVDIPLRWGDLDAQGHVNNALVADYLQESRVEFLMAGGRSDMLDTGVVVVDHAVEYLAPISYANDPLRASLGVLDLGGARFVLGYRLSQAGRTVVRARSTLCPFTVAQQRPRRLTVDERNWFEGHRFEDAPFRALPRVELIGRGHVHPVRPRWSDVDRFHHVNNVRVFDYVQEARIAMTTAADPSMARQGSDPGQDQPLWLVARQDVHYQGQMAFRMEPYHVHTAVVGVGRTSITLNTEVVDPHQGAFLARAATVLVCADPTGRPMALTEHHRSQLQPWLVAPVS